MFFRATKNTLFAIAQAGLFSATTSAARSALDCGSPDTLFPDTSTPAHAYHSPDFIGPFPYLPIVPPEFQFPFPPPIPLTDIPLTVPIQTFSALLWAFCNFPSPILSFPPLPQGRVAQMAERGSVTRSNLKMFDYARIYEAHSPIHALFLHAF